MKGAESQSLIIRKKEQKPHVNYMTNVTLKSSTLAGTLDKF